MLITTGIQIVYFVLGIYICFYVNVIRDFIWTLFRILLLDAKS